jgi:hypothetical protein
VIPTLFNWVLYLARIWADGGYAGQLVSWVKERCQLNFFTGSKGNCDSSNRLVLLATSSMDKMTPILTSQSA